MKNLTSVVVCTMLAAILTGPPLSAQQLVSDLRPGMDGSEPRVDNILIHDGLLYFIGYDGDGPFTKLFSTDAHTVTRLAGNATFTINVILGALDNSVFFYGFDFSDVHGPALYKVDIPSGVPEFVADLDINSTTNDLIFSASTVYNGRLFFVGADDAHGYEIWSTDGTSAGTSLLKDIEPGSGNSIIFTSPKKYFGELNGKLYFGAGTSANGAELWVTDGTEAGTMLVKDIEPDNSAGIPQFGSNPAFFTDYNGRLYFSAFTIAQDRELWVTDGTEAGTQLVKDLSPGGSTPSELTVHNGKLYFNAYRNNEGYSLYMSDGTNAGTAVVKEISAGGPESPNGFAAFDNRLFFQASNSTVYSELWSTNGTPAGTVVAANLSGNDPSMPRGMLGTSNYLYVQAQGNDQKYRIFRSGQNVAAMTLLGTDPDIYAEEAPLYLINGCILFVGNDDNTGKEFYSICNQVTEPTAIETHQPADYMVYPNPTEGTLHIQAKETGIANMNLQLYTIDGRLVHSEVHENTEAGQVVSIMVPTHLPGGIYVLSVDDGKQQSRSRISVIR